MRFAKPFYFLLIAVIPLYYWLKGYFTPKNKYDGDAALAVSSTSLYKSKQHFFARYFHVISDVLITLALLFFIIALARPQGGKALTTQNGYGVDIVLAIDTSGSMYFVDSLPANARIQYWQGVPVYMDKLQLLKKHCRLAIAKKVIESYIKKQTFNRIGIVTFASYSTTLAPLTLDKKMLEKIIEGLKISDHPQQTAIGIGIATAINRLKYSKAKSKVIILLTDGDNNAGLIDPMTAAQLAREEKIKIYTIGLGNPRQFLVPINKYRNAYQLQAGKSINEASLKAIAETTGGKFYRAKDKDSLQKIYNDIDRLEKTKVSIKRRVLYHEMYIAFIIAGLLSLILYLIWTTVIVKLP